MIVATQKGSKAFFADLLLFSELELVCSIISSEASPVELVFFEVL